MRRGRVFIRLDSAPRMRAATVHRPGEVVMQEVAIPQPQPGQVRLAIESCGVCASNLAIWQGQPWFSYPQPPGALGHEAIGRIDAVGPDVSGWEVGQRVAALSERAYAEFDVASASALVALPEEVSSSAFPGEPLGCAMNIFRRAQISAGDTVAIVGIGFLGALLTQLALHAGARVLALSRREYSLSLARSLGASAVISTENHGEAVSQVQELTAGNLCSVVIEAVGKQSALDLATELTGIRGRLVIAGYHQDGLRSVNLQLWNWRGLDVINAHERDPAVYLEGMRAALSATQAGYLRPAPLCTHTLPLEELGTALDLTRDRPDGFLKAIVRP